MFDEAETAYKEALEIKCHSLGTDHVYTAITQDHLAQLFVRRGKFSEAEPLYHLPLHFLL
jgi:Tetratricopeptide repeat